MFTNNSKIRAKDSIIIFHRPIINPEENFKNQHTFLEAHKQWFPGHIKIIDYVPGNEELVSKVFDVFRGFSPFNKKINVIIQSALSQKECKLQYNLHSYFQGFKAMDLISLYLMDSDGRLYEEVRDTNKIEWL